MKKTFDKIKNRVFAMQKFVCKYLAIIVLFIEYWLVVLPTGIIMQFTGRDRLSLKRKDKKTYWTDNIVTSQDYERQF